MSTKSAIRKTGSGNFEYHSNSKIPSNVYSPLICDRMLGYKPIHLRSNAYEEKEVEKIRDKSGARKYLIPSKVSTVYPKIMTKKEYKDLKERCCMITKEERLTIAEAAEKEKKKLTKESIERKEMIRRMDMKKSREKDSITREIEEEVRKRTLHVLERVHNMRMEQEEEIQKCNRLILETKCRAIRDAQIAERKLIERELREEEKRLNNMMENERKWVIKEESRKEQEEIAKRLQFAKFLKEQILKNEEQRILEFERKQEENRFITLNNIAWQQDEIEKLHNKEAENIRMRQELAEENEQLKYFKAMEQEENKIIDLRIQNYHRLKEERKVEKAKEQRLGKLRKEQEKARVMTQTIQAHELQMQIDEINAAQIQEEIEREWRQKEKEEALKRLEVQRILQREREQQINNKRVMQAIEIERDRREFEKIVRVQQAAFCREKKDFEQKQQQTLMHRNEILKQVNEKERERIAERQKMFIEGLTIRAETAMHKKKLQNVMERKCQQMRENRVPDIYINGIKRMIENI